MLLLSLLALIAPLSGTALTYGYEKQNGTSYPYTPYTGCPSFGPTSGTFCCYNTPYQFYMPLNLTTYNWIMSLFPETSVPPTAQQQALRTAFLSPSIDATIMLQSSASLVFSLLFDGGGYRSQFGIFLLDANNKTIPGSYFDVFSDATLSNNVWKSQSAKSMCPNVGISVTVGPFPKGTHIGFYIHSNGLGQAASCLTSSRIKTITQCQQGYSFGTLPDVYYCYDQNGCPYNPNLESVPGANYFYSIDSMNSDNIRHVAVIQNTGSNQIYLGFEDTYGGGDRDYNDVMVMVTVNFDIIAPNNIVTICNPLCDQLNGACNYNTGKCTCNNPAAIGLQSNCSCDANANCGGCQNGGNCNCKTGVCSCPSGFSGNNCQCTSNVGTCYNSANTVTWSCNRCICPAGFQSPIKGYHFNAVFNYAFGTVSRPLPTGYTLDSGVVFGSGVGWTKDARNFVTSRVTNDLFASGYATISTSNGATWQLTVTPSVSYDVTLYFVNNDNTNSYTHTVLVQGSSVSLTFTGEYSSTTTRVSIGSNGLLAISPSSSGTAQLAAVDVSRIPCSMSLCPNNCSSNGMCNGDTGQCVCNTGYQSPNCQCKVGASACVNGVFGCSTGVCTCNPGYTGTNCQCKTCPGGCLNGGTCNCDGTCTCATGFTGTSCSCASPVGSCVAANWNGTYDCATGNCNCKPGFKGAQCQCLSSCPNNCSGIGTCNCDGSCSCPSGFQGASDCSCVTPVGNCVAANWLGTYNCSTGNCNCKPGYKGAQCQCKSSCPNSCSGIGTCNCDGTCTCPAGYLGAPDCSCATPIGNCNSGNWNGTYNCQTGVCNCKAGFKGVQCQCKSSCPNNCSGIGTCNCDGTCTCPAGFQGAPDCSCVTPTVSSCVNGNGTFNCQTGLCNCLPGFKGNDCSCVASSNTCSGNGVVTCSGTCQCNTGYTGTNCQCRTPVSNCLNVQGYDCSTGNCICLPGYKGTLCDCHTTCPNGCSGHGTCNCDGTCTCAANYTGSDCSCLQSPVCYNGGVGNCATGQCVCLPGYRGTQCEMKQCNTTCLPTEVCSADGRCVCDESQPNNRCNCVSCPMGCNSGNCTCSGTCQCPIGKNGLYCQCTDCSSSCLNSVGASGCNCNGTCSCLPGYHGSDCSCKSCSSCVHGTCNCDGTCTCSPGYTGSDCTTLLCSSQCNSSPNSVACNNGTCVCHSGYFGPNCEFKNCSTPCVNGACNYTTGTCSCNANYFGAACDWRTCKAPCSQVGSVGCNQTGDCICKSGFNGIDCGCSDCLACVNGICGCSGVCTCNPGYTGSDCSCRDCVGKTNPGFAGCACNGTSICQSGYYGSDCSCKTCSSCVNGVCNCDGTCTCNPGYTGSDCSCRDCVGKSNPGYSGCTCNGTSICQSGYYGSDCSCQKVKSPCLNGGDANCDGTCTCPTGFTGSDCSVIVCPNACNVNPGSTGSCYSNGTCICQPNYQPPLCDTRTCNTQCLNGGYCNNGVCSCPSGYFGPSCEFKNCSYCGPMGLCDYKTGTCSCQSGYIAQGGLCNCSTAGCLNNCNGNGQCVCGSCVCNSGFSGGDCSCSTLGCAAMNYCNNHGSCSCNTCTCNSGYKGSDCSQIQCPLYNGIECSGHGACVNGTCVCDDTSSGNDCSTVCIKDACGVCNGNGWSCYGCDGIPNSGLVYDACKVCGGDNSTCAGCDGIPWSGTELDTCGVCGGNGTSCLQDRLCLMRKSCETCNQLTPQKTQPCLWCNYSQSCHDFKLSSQCPNVSLVCPNNATNMTASFLSASKNDVSYSSSAIYTGIAGAVVIGGAIAGGVLFSHRRHVKNVLDNSYWANAAVTNPLYKDRTVRYENPLYKERQEVGDDDDDLQ